MSQHSFNIQKTGETHISSSSSTSPTSIHSQSNDSLEDSREKKRKRTTVTRACLACRKAHARCSEPFGSDSLKCKRCISKGIECVYPEEVQILQMQKQHMQHHQQQQNTPLQFGGTHQQQPLDMNAMQQHCQQLQQNMAQQQWAAPQQNPQNTTPPNFNSQNAGIVFQTAQPSQWDTMPNMFVPSPPVDPLVTQQKNMIEALSKTIQQQAQMLQKMMHQMAITPKVQTSELTNPFIEFFESEHIGVSMWKFVTQHEKVLICANQTFARMVGMNLAELSYKRFTMSDVPILLLGEDRNNPEVMRRYLEQQAPALEMGKQYNSFVNEVVRRLQKTSRVVVFGNSAYVQTLIQQNNIVFAKFERTDTYDDSLIFNHIQMPKTYEIRDLSKVTAKDVQTFGLKYIQAAKLALYPFDTRDITAFQDTPEQQREFERRYLEDKRRREIMILAQRQQQQQAQPQQQMPAPVQAPVARAPVKVSDEELNYKASLEYQIHQFKKHHDEVDSDSSEEPEVFHPVQSAKRAQEFDKKVARASRHTPVENQAESRVISAPSPDTIQVSLQDKPKETTTTTRGGNVANTPNSSLLPPAFTPTLNMDNSNWDLDLFNNDANAFFES